MVEGGRHRRANAEDGAGEDASGGVSVRAIHTLVARLTATGADLQTLLSGTGIDAAELRDPQARLSHAAVVKLWQRAAEASRDPLVALHAVELVHALHVELLPDVTEYLMLQLVASSADLRQAFARLERFYAIVDDGTRVALVSGPGSAVTLAFEVPARARGCRPFVEFSIGIWARVLHGALDTPAPLEVLLRGARPAGADAREYERVLGARVRFSADRDGLAVDTRHLATPLRSARPALGDHLERRAIEAIARLATGRSLTRKVRGVIREALGRGTPTAEQTARTLHTSVRTLARRLAEEGTTHGALLDQVRAELAARHLRDRELVGADVATLVGFSDPTTFHRAFRRWFGCTPAEYRARATGGR